MSWVLVVIRVGTKVVVHRTYTLYIGICRNQTVLELWRTIGIVRLLCKLYSLFFVFSFSVFSIALIA